jgi:hypothetical protein
MKTDTSVFHHVVVARRTVSFPKVCPHCLRPATHTVTLESSRRFVAYYIFATKWKYFSLQVPVCSEAAQRVRWAENIFRLGVFSLLAIVATLAVLDAYLPNGSSAFAKLRRPQFLVLWLVLILPFCLPEWFSRPEKHIRILSADESHVEFGVRDADYARLLATNNAPRSPDTGHS